MRLAIIAILVLIISACVEPPQLAPGDPQPDVFELPIRSVSASGDDGNVPENTLDGDLDTRWSSWGDGEWISFEFDAVYEVQSVDISWYFGDSQVSFFSIEYSEDGTRWVEVFSGESIGTTLEPESYDLTDAAARYVRIVGGGTSKSPSNSITTTSIWGQEVGEDTVYLNYPESSDPTPHPPEPTPEPPDPKDPPTTPPDREPMDLRGDPAFDADSLSAAQRERYESIKAQLANPRESHQNPFIMANRDDSWWYGHYLQTHVQAILLVFRMTGDLELLDHVYELGELMRAKLHDSWRDTKDGTDGTSDGYLNWVLRMPGGGDHNYGKDTHVNYEMRAHATVALMAYALHNNRDLTSPNGYDYAAQADFWEDYLINHFEAKWRSRKGTTDGSFPIFPRHDPPSYSGGFHWMQWHNYMGSLTGNDEYTEYAEHLAAERLERLVLCPTDVGDAYVWLRSEPSWYGSGTVYGDYLAGATYEEMTMASAVDLHFEGFDFVADPIHLERWSRTFTQYVIDDPNPNENGFARSVGGEQDRCGLPYREANYRRMTDYDYFRMSWSRLSPWDDTGIISDLTNDMETRGTRFGRCTIRLLTSQMLEEHLDEVS